MQGVESRDEAAGAKLRISGARPASRLSGSTDWRQFACEFQVEETREVEFVCELRADKGDAFFDADTLQVVPIQ